MEMTSSSWTDPGDESAVTETSTHISSGAIVGQTPRLVVSSHNVANKEVSPHQMGMIGSWASASWVIIKAYFAWFILVDDKSTIFKERAHEASPKQLLAPPTPNHRWLQNKPRTASLNSKLTLRTPEGRGLFKNARCPQWPDLFFNPQMVTLTKSIAMSLPRVAGIAKPDLKSSWIFRGFQARDGLFSS